MQYHFLVLLIGAASASRVGQAPPAPSPAGAPGAGPAEHPLDGVKGFVDLLPYSPDRMNYQMTKAKCINFVNQMLDKAGHDATWLPKLMPKCLWTKEECKVLEDDLLSRIPASALPGGPAGAPAPAAPAAALLAKKTIQKKYEAFVGDAKSPGGGDAIFGWCDTLYNMAKTRFFTKIKEHNQPAPGVKALPSDTGNVHRDAKAMNKWLAEHGMLADGHKAEEMSHEDKIIHKMHKVGDALKAVRPVPEHAKESREQAKNDAEKKGVWGGTEEAKKEAQNKFNAR